jgi:hypothetical protein
MQRLLPALAVIALAASVHAKNIDLSTVPSRDSVQLTIYNAEDLTLVRETRVITFKQGMNPLQFSWANTLIDPTSVELKFLTDPDKLTVLDTTFPHDKPQMLYWNVKSELAGEATVQITYFTSGISWSADYTAITTPQQDKLRLEGFVTVSNRSGEDYENAQVRLVVGTINLVEKIEELARRGLLKDEEKGAQLEFFGRARRKVMQQSIMAGEAGMMDAPASALEQPKQIIKEGLSEYFIFTVEGTETIPDQWSKRMRSFDVAEVPITEQYRYRLHEYGDQLVRMFLLTNDEQSGLGQSPLPDGIVRLYKQTGQDSLSYLAAQSIKYIPIGDKIELNLGPNPQVVFELLDLSVFRDNIWMQLHGVDVLRRVDEPGIKIDPKSTVAGWNTHTILTQRIRNYTPAPINVEIRRELPGDVIFRSELTANNHDYQTVQYQATIDAGQWSDLLYEVITKEGRNQEQNRVVIEQASPATVPWRS